MIYIEEKPPKQGYENEGYLYSLEVTTESYAEFKETLQILQEFQEELQARIRRKVKTL